MSHFSTHRSRRTHLCASLRGIDLATPPRLSVGQSLHGCTPFQLSKSNSFPSHRSCSVCHSSVNLSLSPRPCLFWLVLRAICSLPDNKRPSSEQVRSSIQGSPLPLSSGDFGKRKIYYQVTFFPSWSVFSAIQFTLPLTGLSSPPSPSCCVRLPAFPQASQSLLPVSSQVSFPESWGITSFPSLHHMLFYACLPSGMVPTMGHTGEVAPASRPI